MTTVETSVPDVIKYTSVVFASLSLLGAIYIFISSLLHKRLRSFSFRMILWMCIFDAILGCATICGPLGTIEEEAGIENESGQDIIHKNLSIGSGKQSTLPLTCQLQAASIQFSILASLLWTLCFTIHLFRISSVNVNPNRTHSYASLFIYLFISIVIPLFLTYYIFAKGIVGVSSDFWCWINNDYLNEWGYKMLYIEVAILVIILFLLYFIIKCHLKQFIAKSNNDLLNNENNNDLNNDNIILNRSRLTFVRTISGGLSCYLFAPFISFIPAHFNYVCTIIGLESYQHVLSWYVLSGVLLGVIHIGIYICGISIVRLSWSNTCCNNNNNNKKNIIKPNVILNDINIQNIQNDNNNLNDNLNDNVNVIIQNNNNKLQNLQKHYMELV